MSARGCRAPYPKGDLHCVKDKGHEGNHATVLGYHPERADGYGNHLPEEWEFDEWPAQRAPEEEGGPR